MIRVSQSFLSLEIANPNLEMVSNWYPGRACKTDPNMELVNGWYPGRAYKTESGAWAVTRTQSEEHYTRGCFHPVCTPAKPSSFQQAHFSSSARRAERRKRLDPQKLYSSIWGQLYFFSHFEDLTIFKSEI